MIENRIPDHTAIRVALWRAMHVQTDSSPYVFKDEIGLRLVAPDENWSKRPDMHPEGTKGYRASIVGRARFIEDLVEEKIQQGIEQYVILGAGLDTFVQRRPEIASKIVVYEIDRPQTQCWKYQRLIDLGYGIPHYLKFVPVDFEKGESWIENLQAKGFQLDKPGFIASTGVSMYLTHEANKLMLKKISSMARGTTFVMTFMLPAELVESEDRESYKMVMERTRAAGTPFLSLFSPSEILKLAQEAGLKNAKHVSQKEIIQRYFTERNDGLRPSSGEEFLIIQV